MVDALNRAGRWLKAPRGRIVDLRPAEVVPVVELGLTDGSILRVGVVTVGPDRSARHAAADAALRTVVDRGAFRVEHEETFAFLRYPDSATELRDYLATTWRHTRLDDATHARAVEMHQQHPGARLCLRERVAIRTLVPLRAHE
jgi:hypothetical protein